MYLDADELRPCRACGAPCDGDVCDAFCADRLASCAHTGEDIRVRFNPATGTKWLYCGECGSYLREIARPAAAR